MKGSDYEIADIVGAEAVIKGGGLVKTLDFISGYSSSSIIDSIKKGF